jgi:hypothetical protein
MIPRYFIGLDFGQAQDFTAAAILERQGGAERTYAGRHLQRWPLGTSYPEIVQDVLELTRRLTPAPVLVVDATGVGQPVVGLLRRAGISCPLYAITITAGHAVASSLPGYINVPKKELVSVMQVLLQTRRLKIAPGLPDAPTLIAELANFQAKIIPAASDTVGPWREGAHDDLVLAVALAGWFAERVPEPPTGPLVWWPAVGQAREEQADEPKSFLQRVFEENGIDIDEDW